MTQRILVVPTAPIPTPSIRSMLRESFPSDAEFEIIAPASHISWLDWLTNAEDDARAEAAEHADQAAEAVPGEPSDSRVGDTDPLQAIDDALRTFPADQVVVVTRPDDQASWLEAGAGEAAQKRFEIPVTHLVISA
ncbi:MAG TPA: hypothetical protein VG652_02800 [Gaiellaceae bacterium]|nr:hypothetical protein [Gaiellaceae bacterium]